jgi:hypothetical protein
MLHHSLEETTYFFSVQILIKVDWRCFKKPPFPSKYLNRWANLALRDIVSEQKVFQLLLLFFFWSSLHVR